jgi:hypothetical protein
MTRMTTRIRYLTWKLRALKWVLWRLAGGAPRRPFCQAPCGRIFAIVRYGFFNLAGQYAHDVDSVADYVGRGASRL